MEAAQFWNKVANRYAKSPIANVEAYEATLDHTLANLNPSDVVLELGCGTGTTALKLASSVSRYVASDFAANMVEIGRRKAEDAGLDKLEFQVGQLGDPDFGQGSYDAVLSFNMLHLLDDLPAALQQIHGLVRPGGHFISKTPCWPTRSVPLKYRALSVMLPVMRLLGKAPDYVNLRTIPELESLIRAAGFELVEVGDYPNHPPSHFIVARRPLSH